jgi:hypothetical protein
MLTSDTIRKHFYWFNINKFSTMYHRFVRITASDRGCFAFRALVMVEGAPQLSAPR